MKLKDDIVLLIGIMSLAIGILVGRFIYFLHSDFLILNFVGGVLLGLSLVMNLFYLVKKSKKLNIKS